MTENSFEEESIDELLWKCAVKGNPSIFKMLIVKKGANVNVEDKKSKRSVLHCAVLNHHIDIVKILLDHGVDPNREEQEFGWYPLDFAIQDGCYDGDFEIADLLVKHDALMSYSAFLDKVMANDNLGEVEKFLEYAAKPNVKWFLSNFLKDHKNEDIFDFVKLLGKGAAAAGEIQNLLNSKGIPLYRALKLKRYGQARNLLRNGASPNVMMYADGFHHRWCNCEGAFCNFSGNNVQCTAFHMAIINNMEMALMMLDHGADPNLKMKDAFGQRHSPLNLAIIAPYIHIQPNKLVEKLIKMGAEIDSDEEIPLLHQAMMADQEDIFTLLLESGANGDYLNESTKDSLLHLAIKKNRCTFVKILLEKGRANYDIRNNLGLTPLELSLKIADMLVEHDCFKTIVFHNHHLKK